MDPLEVYKAEVYAANVVKANKTVRFSRVLAAIDYAPIPAMLFTAAVLSVILILLYIIIISKWPNMFNFLNPYISLVYQSLWLHEGTRYMSFALALTNFFLCILCVKSGGFWWLLYICLFLQMAFIVGRILKFRSSHTYVPPHELEDVFTERSTPRIQVDEPVDLPEAGPARRTRSISRRSTQASLFRTQN